MQSADRSVRFPVRAASPTRPPQGSGTVPPGVVPVPLPAAPPGHGSASGSSSGSGRPGVAFPPELPDRRFIQPIMPQERCDCIIAGHLSRKITRPAAISGMQPHPIQFQLRTEPHIQRIFLFHLLFLGSGQGAAAIRRLRSGPIFPYRPAVLPAAPPSQSPRPIPVGTGRPPGCATCTHAIQIRGPRAVPRRGRFPPVFPRNFSQSRPSSGGVRVSWQLSPSVFLYFNTISSAPQFLCEFLPVLSRLPLHKRRRLCYDKAEKSVWQSQPQGDVLDV